MKKESKNLKSITERNSNDKSHDRKAIFMSKNIHWATPKKYYESLMRFGYIDPCPLNSKEDGLKKHFKDKQIFINPPFKDLNKWTNWILEEIKNNLCIILLMPARTDTKYFHKLLELNPQIAFIKGRLHFNESKKNAPFPTILLRFDHINNKKTYTSIDSIHINSKTN